MKKLNLKIFSALVIFFGLLVVHQNVDAACNNQFGGKSFDPSITVNRGTPNLTFNTKFKYGASGDCVGVTIPGSFYDFTFSYGQVGGGMTTVSIPDNAAVLKGNEWGTISFSPNIDLDYDRLYNVRFIEENEIPDLKGPLLVAWDDATLFGDIKLKAGSLTSTSAEFEGDVIYYNKAAQVAGKDVPGRNIHARLLKKDGTLIKEYAFTNSAALKYNVTLPLYDKETGLTPNTEYSMVFVDKARNRSSAPLAFKTAAVSNGNGNGNGTTDPCPNYSSGSFIFKTQVKVGTKTFCLDVGGHGNLVNNGQYDAKTFLGFYGAAADITSSDFTNDLYKNSTLKIKKQGTSTYLGELKRDAGTYSKTNVASSKSIVSVDNNSSLNNQFLNPGGYTIDVIYKGITILSEDVCYESTASPTGNKIGTIVCGDAGNSGKVLSGTAPDNNIAPPDNSSVGIGNNGVQATFDTIALLDIGQNTATITGTITYSRDLTTAEQTAKSGHMKTVFYKPNGDLLTLADMNVTFPSAKKANVKATLSNLDPADGPYKIAIWDEIFNAHSAQFLLKQNGQSSSTGGLDGAGNNININFDFGTALADEISETVKIGGTLTYSRDLTAAEIQYKMLNKIVATVYDSLDRPVGTVASAVTFTKLTAKKFSVTKTFTGIDATKADHFIVKDDDFKISSDPFDLDRVGGGGAVSLNAAYTAEDKTIGTTTVSFTEPTITAGTATSATVNGSVKYTDTTKTGTTAVANENIIAKVYIVNAQGGLDYNSEKVANVTANYNQPSTLTVSLSPLDGTRKYAVQFVEKNYGEAKSIAKVIEIVGTSFAPSTNQPGVPGNPGTPGTPGTPSGNTRGILNSPLKDGLNSIPGIVAVLVDDIVIPIAVPLLALAIMYTGFLFVQARGNTAKLEEAKKALKWTLLGGAVILGAYVIATALQSTIADIVKKP